MADEVVGEDSVFNNERQVTQPSVDMWRPIATAPKDGTYILVARAGEDIGCGPVEITNWYKIEDWKWEQVPGDDPDLYRKVKGAKPYHEGWNNNGHRATHWMPLPPVPQTVGSDDATTPNTES